LTIVIIFVLEMFLIIIDIPTEEWMGQSDPILKLGLKLPLQTTMLGFAPST